MRIESGNLMDVQSGVIVHQVNCMGAFGAGVAGQIASRYPIVKRNYLSFCQSKRNPRELFGLCLPVRVSEGLVIINAFSQFAYGNAAKTGRVYTDQTVLLDCIGRVRQRYPNQVIYLPWRIGCGLAGGDWNAILSQLRDVYANDDNLVIVRRPGD